MIFKYTGRSDKLERFIPKAEFSVGHLTKLRAINTMVKAEFN